MRRPALSHAQVAILAIAAIGATLRWIHIGHELPDFVEEAIPLRQALERWIAAGHVEWNPHRFHYPSLAYDLHLLLQIVVDHVGRVFGAWRSDADFLLAFLTDPTPMVRASRGLQVALDTGTVVVVGVIGERLRPGAGVAAAAVTALSATLIATSRLIYTDTLLALCVVLCLERILAYARAGGRGRLIAAAVWAGLAASAKYPGAVMLAPLLLVVLRREPRAVGQAGLAIAIALAVFVVTTPFAILDAQTFANDAGFLGHMAASGHLGNFDRPGFGFYVANLARDPGVPALVLLVMAAAGLIARRPGFGAAALVLVAFLAFAAPISIAKVEAERYLVPVIPLVALLAAWGAFAWADVMRAPWGGRVAVLAACVMVIPVAVHGAVAAWQGAGSTMIEARRWCEAHLGPRDLVLQELYGPPLRTRLEAERIQAGDLFRAASPAAREAYLARRWYAAVALPIATVGRVLLPVRDPQGHDHPLDVVPQGADLDAAFYDPRMLDGVDIVITSSAVRARFEADPRRFAVPCRWYAFLDRVGDHVASFDPRGSIVGPEIRVYRLGPRAHADVAALGPLPPWWWTSVVPASFRARAQAIRAPGEAGSVGAPIAPDGTPAAWMRSLGPLFELRFASFAIAMTVEHEAHGDPALALPYACSLLDMQPDNLGAFLSAARCARAANVTAAIAPRLLRAFSDPGRLSSVPSEARPEVERALAEARTAIAGAPQ